jgi:hypothetical protein
VHDTKDFGDANRTGSFPSHTESAQSCLATNQHECSKREFALASTHQRHSLAGTEEQRDDEYESRRPDSKMRHHPWLRSHGTGRYRDNCGGERRKSKGSKVSPNRRAQDADEKTHESRQQPMAVFEADRKIRPPAVRVEASKTQRPVRNRHACLPACDQPTHEDQAEDKAHGCLSESVESFEIHVCWFQR